MKAFLADYGLTWVGGPAPPPKKSAIDASKLLAKLQQLDAKVSGRARVAFRTSLRAARVPVSEEPEATSRATAAAAGDSEEKSRGAAAGRRR